MQNLQSKCWSYIFLKGRQWYQLYKHWLEQGTNNNTSNRNRSRLTKIWSGENIRYRGILGVPFKTWKNNCSFNTQFLQLEGERAFRCRNGPCKKYENVPCQTHNKTTLKRKNKLKSPTTTLSLNKIYAFLCLIAVAINLNSLFGDYVHDDLSVVLNNPDVQGKTPIWGLFLNDFWGTRITEEVSHKSYRPLTVLSFRLEHWWMGSSCAFVSHAVNVLLHLLVTLLYANVLHNCLRVKPPHVLYSGAMFALHPIHTEAVTGIVGRADVLAALAFLAAFYAYCKLLEVFHPLKVCLWTAGFTISVCLGILCKETAITIIPVCILWDFLIFMEKINKWRKMNKELLSPVNTRLGWLILLALILLLLRMVVMQSIPTFSKQDNPASSNKSFQTRFLSYLFLPSLNLWLMMYPWLLSHDWQLGSVPLVEELSDCRNVASTLLFLGLFLLLCRGMLERSKESNLVVWALAVMIFSFLPASNIFFRVGFVLAERILYIPSIGFCALSGLGLFRVEAFLYKKGSLQMRASRLWWTIKTWAVILLLLFAVRTLRRNADWLTRESLLRAGLRTLPLNAKMHYNYANSCRDRGIYGAAVDHYHEAVRLWPDYPSAHNNLGAVYHELGHSIEAEHHFRQALLYQNDHVHATINLANLLRHDKRGWEAIFLLYLAFDGDKDVVSGIAKTSPKERVRLGLLLADLYADEGVEPLEEEVYLGLLTEFPHSADIQTYYGNFLVKQGKYDAAPRHFEAALSLNPQHLGALTSYAALLEAQFHPGQAQNLYTQALELGWDDDTATSLGKAHLSQGRIKEAEKVLSKVLIQNPHHLEANVHLAQIRLQQRHYHLSEVLLQDVLRTSPDDRQALYHLSLLFATTNRSAESLLTARKAARGCVRPRAFCAALYAHLADLLHTNTMLEAAIENYKKALNLEPSLVKARLNLGAIHHSQGNFSSAWDHYIEALKIDPENTLVLENIWKLQHTWKNVAHSIFDGN